MVLGLSKELRLLSTRLLRLSSPKHYSSYLFTPPRNFTTVTNYTPPNSNSIPLLRTITDLLPSHQRTTLSQLSLLLHFHPGSLSLTDTIIKSLDVDGTTGTVLEVGCGLGGILFEVARRHKDVETLVGFDAEKEYIDVANGIKSWDSVSSEISGTVFSALSRMRFIHHRIDSQESEPPKIWEFAPTGGVQRAIISHVAVNLSSAGLQEVAENLERSVSEGGKLVIYEPFLSCRGGYGEEVEEQEVKFPLPFARDREDCCFLRTKEEFLRLFGAEEEKWDLVAEKRITVDEILPKRGGELPPVSLKQLLGEGAGVKVKNLVDGVRGGGLEIWMMTFVRK